MGDVTQAGFTTPLTTPVDVGQLQGQGSIFMPSAERRKGDGILPSPPLAIPLRQIKIHQPTGQETRPKAPVKVLELPL